MFKSMKFVLRLSETIDSFGFDRTLGKPAAGFDERAKLSETRIFGQSFFVARVDLLDDDGDLQQTICEIENRIGISRPERRE